MPRKRKAKVEPDVQTNKKIKKEKQYHDDLVVNMFVDLYKKTVDMSDKPTEERKAEVHEELSQKFITKHILWYPIYTDRPDSYQADLICSSPLPTRKAG